MAHMRYGCLSPNPKTIMYPVAASQYFRHDYPHFVFLDGSGHVELAVTATATIFGCVAAVPKGQGSGSSDDYWLSSATAGADELPIILTDEHESYLFLADDTPTASQAGDECDLLVDNDGTAGYIDIGTSSTDVCIIQGRGVDFKADAGTNDVVVKINPEFRQHD